MPYRHGHYYVGFVLLVIMVGFWASYWSPIANVPTAFHVHAISSSSWLLLLIVQSVAIHRRSNAMWNAPGIAWLGELFAAYARVPQAITFGAGILARIAAGWLGWKAGLPPPRQARPAPTPI